MTPSRRSIKTQPNSRAQNLNTVSESNNKVSITNSIEIDNISNERDLLKKTYDELRDACVSAFCRRNMMQIRVDRLKSKFNNMGMEINSIELESEAMKREIECKICLTLQMDVIFHPCRHVIACDSCAGRLRQCPYCRAYIQVLPIYF